MGLMDKAKFWKKGGNEDDLGDLSDLGDFGLDDKPGAGPAPGGFDDLGPLPDLGESGHPAEHAEASPHREDVQPTQASLDMGEQLGLSATPATRPGTSQTAATRQAPAYGRGPEQQMYRPEPGLGELAKDIEIIHAKLDAIRSSLDSINQRLATLERLASPDSSRNRYSW